MPVLLGANLVGIYLYGSLTQRAFDPKRSDIDVIVVTRRDLSPHQFQKVRRCLDAAAASDRWISRLQMSFLQRDEILTANSKYCLYQFGRLKRGRSDANPIIWINVLNSGVVLYGPPPQSFVPAISDDLIFKALEREVGYLREELVTNPLSKWKDVPFYRDYAVMTLCRILYTSRRGAIVSKPRATKWAMENLPEQWKALIFHAQQNDAGMPRRALPLNQIRKFVAFAYEELERQRSRRGRGAVADAARRDERSAHRPRPQSG
jgi:hypothetical protein